MDDAQLLRLYVDQGSEAAFSELVGRHLGLVHSAAMRQVGGDFHLAKDVSQIVFALLARKAPSLTGHATLTGWLYSTTHFSAGTVMRGERRRRIREEETYHMNELLACPEAEINWNRLRPMLDGAMIELNERDREAILWRFFDALPFAVIGEKMGVGASGAKKRVDHALDKMRASLGKRGATSTTAALAAMLAEHAVVAAPAGLAETVTASALTSAAAAQASSSWALKFLGKTKSAAGLSGLIWVGGVLSIPAIGVAAHELWTAWQANAALVKENEGYEAQQERFWALKRAAASARPAVPHAVKSGAPIQDPRENFQKFLATYPQSRAMIVAYQKSILGHAYASFFRSTGLTSSQIEQFENTIAENWIPAMTLGPGKFSMIDGPTPAGDQMRAILGDRDYQQFQSYGQTVYAHCLAYAVAGNSSATSLSVDQLDQLALIVAANNAAPPPAYSITPSPATINWGAVLAQAKAVFSAAQWRTVEPALLLLQASDVPAMAPQSQVSTDARAL